MDELDLLLEELALSSTGSDNVQENRNENTTDGKASGALFLGRKTKENNSACSNVHSDLPGPVAASQNPDLATEEMNFVLQDLMALAEGDPEPSSTPPPLTQKQSVKKKTEDGQQKKKEGSNSSSPAGSRATASTKTQKADTIDDLLGGLSSDLEKIGIRTTAKGHCASCNKCIVGKMITALGEVWHPEHFVCVVCKMELSTTGFFEREGRPYCHKDYHQLFAPRCAYCKGAIMQKILTALDQTWHPEHFFCAHCGGLFGQEGYMQKDGKPYCFEDFYQLFAPKCSGCGESVKENYLTAANGTWHPECFVCALVRYVLYRWKYLCVGGQPELFHDRIFMEGIDAAIISLQQIFKDCLQPFTSGCFMELDGRPLCSLHFHSRQGTLCGSCGEPITGRCISALDRKFHPEHFVCAFCLRQLSHGIFKEQKGKPYCSACFNKLFL